MTDRPTSTTRGVLRLVVPSPDGSRVLARPNGLAGWALPSVAVTLPFERWDDHDLERAAAIVGATVEPVGPVGEGAWHVRAQRVGAAGNTWISEHEADRLGNDAATVRGWFRSRHDGGAAD